MSDVTYQERIREKFRADRFAVLLGIEMIDFSPGYAKTQLKITDQHFNAVNIVQGGVLFTLADFTFAVAANCGETTEVGIETQMSFLKPARSGTLFAEGREISRSRTLASYDVEVTDEKGALIAKFHGRSYILR